MITICAVGRLRVCPLAFTIQEYQRRLHWPLTVQEVDIRQPGPALVQRQKEAAALQAKAPRGVMRIALDEKGEAWSTQEFKQIIQQAIQDYHGVCFFIGGDLGLDPCVSQASHHMMALGRLTWPHMMVRLLLIEQLYRVQQIMKNHPYHRGD